jgi:subtilisin family serine protease
MRRRSIALGAAIILVLAQVATATARSAPAPAPGAESPPKPAAAKVEKGLLDRLGKGDVAAFVVEFASTADLVPAKKIRDHGRRGQYVLDALRTTASASQKEARALVKATKGAAATSYWITNVLVVEGDAKLAARLARVTGVTEVRAPRTYPLVRPVDTATAILAAAGDPEWGVDAIGAPAAWADGVLGQGIVVANVDTGVDYLHPALVNQYRGSSGDGTFNHDYSWWDPTGICGGEPCDNVGHGTHTMGTMVGGDGPGDFTPDIGVAPAARWIAAKGCEDFGCSEQALLSSGQFILAPTDLAGKNPDPARRPDIVNNSWGGGPGDTFYLETVQAWRAAGIIPVFASGNPGPECGQGGSPGDFPEVLSAGATDSKDMIAEFSGRGPSVIEGKAWNPDIAAPGVDVVSSVPGGGYEAYSGTSMAAPHASGEIALILSARAALIGDFEGVASTVRATALDRIDEQCGAAPGGDPNNVYGDGRIDAAAAVALVKTGGTLAGTVTSTEDGTPVAGATVSADNGSREFRATTDAAGTYSIFLAAGDYGVDARAFGFHGATAGSVTVVTDATTVQDFALVPLPRFDVTGHVTAAEDGGPIADVMVAALGVPVVPVTTDAAGAYTMRLPIGTYSLRFSAGGCTEVATADVESDGPDVVVDRALFRKLDDFGHGCRPVAFDWVDAATQTALWGDELAGRLRLPFAFDFYGTPYDQLWLSDNGYVNFLAPDQYNGYPVAIPSRFAPNAAIYPLWQDLYLDAQSQVDYELVGTAPDRAFVVEYAGIRAWGTAARFSFELKLWEDGTLDLLYGDNPANPGDGRNALVGIENASGTDALQFSFREPVVGRNAAYRFEIVPSGLLHGTVTDANDGLPIAGATVTASPGGRTARTDADGAYTLRLRPGSYAITIAAPPYVSATQDVTIVDGGDVTADAALAGGLGTVEPAAISATVDYGQLAAATITLANEGSAPLAWEAKKRDLGTVLPPLPEPEMTVHRAPTWTRPVVPRGFPITATTTPPAGDLLPIIEDPAGDARGSVDVTTVRGGSDGSTTASLALEFTPGTPMSQLTGFVFLDTDQDSGTGDPADWWWGLPSQDVGVDYVADLWGLQEPDPVVYIIRTDTYDLVAIVPATIDGQTVAFDMPLEALGGDDGYIDVAMVVGDWNGPTDWAPDSGHGTITPFVDLAWLAESPESGVVPAGATQEISLALGGATLEPGEYHGLLVLLTDGPKSRQVSVPVDLTVTMPDSFGAIRGTATAAHTGQPLAGVEVGVDVTWQGSPLHLAAMTDGDGAYRIVGPEGTWPASFTLPGYLDSTPDVTIVRGVTTGGVDVELHRIQPHAALDPGSASFVLTEGRTGTRILTLSNAEGHVPLAFTVNEVALDGGMAAAGAARVLPAGADQDARTTRAAPASATPQAPPAIRGEGDVLASWPADLSLPWGVGYTGNVVLSDPIDLLDVTFTTAGERLGQFGLPWAGAWGGDMAYDAGRGLIWQVNVGGDNGIYGLDPADGTVVASITGSPWSQISQRGLAYDRIADEFYVGGWNEGILYRVAGPSHPTPGETLGQCYPADPSISGLAWNMAFGLVWAATNSEADTIYLLDPTTCETLRALPHPDGGGYGGAGLELDAIGNLWTVGQNSGNAYLVESGLPLFSDVPWLSVSPVEGAIAPDESAEVAITVDTTGLEPGVHEAIVVVMTNDPDHGMAAVPVVLVVPAFQQGVNAGGGAHANANGDVFAADRAYGGGPFGYVGASSVRSTKRAIDGTTEDPLYQSLRTGMTGYRFAVPEGRYRVDLGFAEIVARKAGSRVFSVAIEGQTVLANFDVFAVAGRDAALDRWFEVDVTDGQLDITFTAQRGDAPIVNAILVTEVPPGSPAW